MSAIETIGTKSFGLVAATANDSGSISISDTIRPFNDEFFKTVICDITKTVTSQKVMTESILNSGAFTRTSGTKSNRPASSPTTMTVIVLGIVHLKALNIIQLMDAECIPYLFYAFSIKPLLW
jgi:hypothetical protein